MQVTYPDCGPENEGCGRKDLDRFVREARRACRVKVSAVSRFDPEGWGMGTQ
jgi:hypothetical protein